jgi:mono/diheme cytochrome c family protein
MVRRTVLVLGLLAIPGGVDGALGADPVLSPGFRFSEQTGEALYANVCLACHMGNGGGATGAGRYPSLVKNPKLETEAEAVHLILHGQGAMPAVGRLMSDEQVAAVVNYIRTHFGNDYKEPVTAEQVQKAR